MESAPAVAAPTPTGASYASEVPHGIGAQGGGGRGATRPVSSASAPMLSSLLQKPAHYSSERTLG